MTAPALTGVERHIDAAIRMLLRGVRPTVDLVVAECGGSRSTAQKALNDLWTTRLPGMLDARSYEDGVPVPVREAIGALWREARQQADSQALDALARQTDQLDLQRAELAGILAGIDAERATAARRIAELEQALSAHHESRDIAQRALFEARAQISQLHAAQEQSAAQLAESRRELQQAQDAIATQQRDAALASAVASESLLTAKAEAEGRLQDASASFAAERQALLTAQQQAFDALKEAYHDSEQRLRVENDALKTELSRVRRDAENASRAAAEKLDTLRAHTVELGAQLAKKSNETGNRRPWRKPRNTLPKTPR